VTDFTQTRQDGGGRDADVRSRVCGFTAEMKMRGARGRRLSDREDVADGHFRWNFRGSCARRALFLFLFSFRPCTDVNYKNDKRRRQLLAGVVLVTEEEGQRQVRGKLMEAGELKPASLKSWWGRR